MYKCLLPILFMFSICFSDSNKMNLIDSTAGQINNKNFKAVFLGSTQLIQLINFLIIMILIK